MSMLRCIHGVGGGHVNIHVKCIRCRCYVAYMGWGGMLTFMWSAYGVDATFHTWGGGGHVNVHVKCIQCRCHVGGGHVNVHMKCIRCRCYVAYMGWGGTLMFMWSAYGVDATMHTWRVHVRCPWMPCACACGAMYGCGTGDTGSRVKDPMF